jgi:hypothetical protein
VFRTLAFVRAHGKASKRLLAWLRRVCCVFVTVVFAAGCASARHHQGPPLDAAEGRNAAQPPFFLVGPAGVLLTNAQDFTARLMVAGTNSLTTNTVGNLFQQEGILLFVPRSEESTGASAWTGSFRFLWDPRRNSGYVISERLHGYASAASPNHYTAPSFQTPVGPPVVEQIDGQPCVRDEVSINSSNGQAARFRVWRGEEPAGPPLRIVSTGDSGSSELNVQLSDINLDALSPELFSLPTDFARFASTEAMVHQLMRKAPVLPYSHSEGSSRRRR